MKLIDLLVRELPKHGGWPEGVECIEQASDGSLFDARQLAKPYLFSEHHFALANDWNEEEIIREQYETGLAESGRKREVAVRAMMSCSAVLLEVTAGLIYDAIAAGEIPHITLK